ncbi:MAG: PilZ domain-containing protein [Candidatus Omnitrophica bacterium]|nr:PilZ domain-containing protein [Candidatus Omnitrophota bacterium]MDD5488942.1 PilZ domain-containing protein [Candidatus Omnitrophota bacterium]
MENHTDNRRFERVTTHIPVKYRKIGGSPGESGVGTITKNLSEGGVRFRAPEFVSRACRLLLELDMPMFNKPVKAISKVAWIRKLPSGTDYEIGNQFLEISRQDKELVSEYVNSLTLYNEPESNTASFTKNAEPGNVA